MYVECVEQGPMNESLFPVDYLAPFSFWIVVKPSDSDLEMFNYH